MFVLQFIGHNLSFCLITFFKAIYNSINVDGVSTGDHEAPNFTVIDRFQLPAHIKLTFNKLSHIVILPSIIISTLL